jgi:hypothetical protein
VRKENQPGKEREMEIRRKKEKRSMYGENPKAGQYTLQRSRMVLMNFTGGKLASFALQSSKFLSISSNPFLPSQLFIVRVLTDSLPTVL